MKERSDGIVVTGVGAWAAGARGARELYDIALAGRSPGRWVSLPGLDEPVAASLAADPESIGSGVHHAHRLDRSAKLGLAAASQAIAQAGLAGAGNRERVGVMVGTSRGPIARTLETATELAAGVMSASASADSTPGSMSGVIGQAFGFGGPSATIVATCASGASAIAFAALHLLADEADAMVVGGAEAPVIPLLVAQLRAAGVAGWHEDPELTCRPFDSRRNGLMIGEGAGFLILERRSSAERRGATPLARLTGWASGVDAGGRTGVTADGDGLVRVVERAVAMAGIKPAAIDYVNAHGTATRLNDAVEARALNRVFGSGSVPPVSSTKPITGHCLGATGAIEAVIVVETLRGGCLPPTANHQQRDPECALDVVAGEARSAAPHAVMSISLGFWGTQAALIFESIRD